MLPYLYNNKKILLIFIKYQIIYYLNNANIIDFKMCLVMKLKLLQY